MTVEAGSELAAVGYACFRHTQLKRSEVSFPAAATVFELAFDQ